MAQHAGYIFFYMIQNLYKNLENRLDHVRDILKDIENQIFSGNERQMVQEVSKLNRLLLNYRESTDLHQEILESFEVAGKKFFGKDFEYHLRSITGEYYKV
jgi:Mg2+ and Co2+ transporter CorA